MSGEEQRAHPRVDLATEVMLTPSGPTLTFNAGNVSLGGLFIAGEPERHPELKPGTHVQIRLCVAEELGDDITCRAQVVRVERGEISGRQPGFAVRFFRLDMKTTMRLGKLIDRRGVR